MSGDFIGDLVCGTAAGTAGKLIDYPLDTVKTRMQAANSAYSGSWQCFREIATKEGIRGFYAGLAAPVAGAACEKAVIFSAYSAGKSVYDISTGFVADPSSQHDPFARCLVGGSLSGIATAIVLTPFELVKCRIQVNPGRWNGVVAASKATVQETGAMSLMNGFVPCLLREVIGNFFWFGVYEGVVRLGLPADVPREAGPWWLFPIAGGIGGVAFWTTSFPLDTVKTRAQVDPNFRALGVAGGMSSVFRSEGMPGLFKGWNVTALRALPSSAAIFTVYEKVSARWKQYRQG